MTAEDITKLVKLKSDIDKIAESIRHLKTYKLVFKFEDILNHVANPSIDLVPGLREGVKAYLITELNYHLEELNDKLNHFTLCNKVTGATTYTPINLDENDSEI